MRKYFKNTPKTPQKMFKETIPSNIRQCPLKIIRTRLEHLLKMQLCFASILSNPCNIKICGQKCLGVSESVTLKVAVSRDFFAFFISWFKPILAPNKQPLKCFLLKIRFRWYIRILSDSTQANTERSFASHNFVFKGLSLPLKGMLNKNKSISVLYKPKPTLSVNFLMG